MLPMEEVIKTNPAHLSHGILENTLGVSSDDRRGYLQLSIEERAGLWAVRKLFLHLQNRRLLKKEVTVDGFLNWFSGKMDDLWFVKGEGRAVDYKAAAVVLQAWADYHKWALTIIDQRQFNLLDIVLPYTINQGIVAANTYSLEKFVNAGHIHVWVNGEAPCFGKKGEVSYVVTYVNVEELTDDPKGSRTRRQVTNEALGLLCLLNQAYAQRVKKIDNQKPPLRDFFNLESGRYFHDSHHLLAQYEGFRGNSSKSEFTVLAEPNEEAKVLPLPQLLALIAEVYNQHRPANQPPLFLNLRPDMTVSVQQ